MDLSSNPTVGARNALVSGTFVAGSASGADRLERQFWYLVILLVNNVDETLFYYMSIKIKVATELKTEQYI